MPSAQALTCRSVKHTHTCTHTHARTHLSQERSEVGFIINSVIFRELPLSLCVCHTLTLVRHINCKSCVTVLIFFEGLVCVCVCVCVSTQGESGYFFVFCVCFFFGWLKEGGASQSMSCVHFIRL